MATEAFGDVSKLSLTAARVAITSGITYQSILILLIFIRPDLDPSWHTISEWAIGPYGWIMTIAFFISALSYASLFVLLRSQMRGFIGQIGLGILFICTIGTFGVGAFTTDPLTTKELSTTGILHMTTGAGALMLLPFAALLINLSLALKNETWNSARKGFVVDLLDTPIWPRGIHDLSHYLCGSSRSVCVWPGRSYWLATQVCLVHVYDLVGDSCISSNKIKAGSPSTQSITDVYL